MAPPRTYLGFNNPPLPPLVWSDLTGPQIGFGNGGKVLRLGLVGWEAIDYQTQLQNGDMILSRSGAPGSAWEPFKWVAP